MNDDFEHRYDDIISLPHPDPDPRRHPRMPVAERAAQFAPFAALGPGPSESEDEPYCP